MRALQCSDAMWCKAGASQASEMLARCRGGHTSGSSSLALRGHDGRLTQSRRRAIARGGCGGRAGDAAS
eukprot:4861363-Prymnesium_polylepis.1